MNKHQLLDLWHKMMASQSVSKEFKAIAFGRGGNAPDGWRKLILRKENVYVEITFERNPCSSLIYSGEYRFELDENDNPEKMAIDFDKMGTLYEGTEITIDRINELL